LNGATHLATGILISAAMTTNPVGIAIGAIAALLPDIDEPNSMISRKIPIIPHIIGFFGHRKITHSLLGAFLFSMPIFIWLPEYLTIFIAGYLSHLLLDTMTDMGTPWLFPVGRNFSLKLGVSGGWLESIYIVCLFVIGSLWGQELFSAHIEAIKGWFLGMQFFRFLF
jgi:inner membrane protein